MKKNKLNCIRARARRKLPRAGGLLALFLLAVLLVTPALADGEIPKESLANKPEVTIQGNVVIDDNGNPTGFYELALCVRSPKRIVGPDPSAFNTVNGTTVLKTDLPIVELSETQYAQVLVDIYQDDPALMPTAAQDAGITEEDYTVTYYPFTAASAVVNVNVDALTPVHWDVETVTYGTWDSTSKTYTDTALDTAYPRGVDVSALDPEVWGMTAPDAFPDVRKARAVAPGKNRVYLDAEGDRSALTAAAVAEHYYTSGDIKAAVITLSAHVGDNKPVIYTKSTPVVVVRFAYDLNRFPKAAMEWNETFNRNNTVNQITGKNDPADAEGFWLGLDRNTTSLGTLFNDGKTPVTWLSDSGMTDPKAEYSYSDYIAAHTDAGQVAWAKYATEDTDGSSVDWDETEYYYYLGATATGNIPDGEGSAIVSTPTGDKVFDHVRIPSTEGYTVLAEGTARNPDPITDPTDPNYDDEWTATAPYSYYENLLYLDGDHSLQLRLINDISFKTGASKGLGGNQILFYDWDDRLIGSLIVGDGDVRQAVNDYVERNFIAPDLRTSQLLDGGEMPTDPTDLADYEDLVNSLDREFTYRGSQYPYKLNGGDALKVEAGDSYPLTNKLDYVFYKRLNIINEVRTPDPDAPTDPEKDTVEQYYTVAKVTDDAEAGKYPYIYGWAVIEDKDNKKIETAGENWAVRLDSAKTENTWTTFDSGELLGLEPTYIAQGYTPLHPLQPIPAAAVESQPGGLSAPLPSPAEYDYKTSTADANGYLRFADFSDMSAMLKDGQDVLLVKAVYEPGTDLLAYANYTTVEGSLYTTRYSIAASTGNAVYSIQYQYQRANDVNGDWQGVKRVREPAVQTSYTYDINEFDDPEKEIDQKLNSNRAFMMKTVSVNSDIMDIDLLTGGVIWKIDYILVDLYGGLNVATGNLRSAGKELNLKTGFTYPMPGDPSKDYVYADRYGTNSLIVDSTINQIMEHATAIARGESTEDLSVYFSRATVTDLNLKMDMDGTEFGSLYGLCAQYTQNLVDAIIAAYPDSSTAPAGIFDKNGNVTLTWHQLQRHIIMSGGGNTAGIFNGTTLTSDSDCAGFPWCRYDTCSANVSMSINNVNDLLNAIRMTQTNPPGSDNYKKAQDAIDGLTGAQLYAYGFRTQSDGVPYDKTLSDAALKTAILDDLKAATTKLAPTLGTDPDWSTVTWTQIQTEIIKDNMGASAPAVLDLWWEPTAAHPNGVPPTISNWDDLWKYSIHAVVGVDGDSAKIVPDAFDGFTQTALNNLVSEKPGTSTATNVGWFRTGQVTTVDGEEVAVEFADADAFAAAWKRALTILTTPTASGGGGYTAATVSSASWEEIQYALIDHSGEIPPGPDYKTQSDILNDPNIDYWWKAGGSPKLTLERFLPAAWDCFNGDNNKIDTILNGSIDPINNDLYLRKANGVRFASDDEFKTILNDAYLNLMVYDSTFFYSRAQSDRLDLTWNELQWLLINYKNLATGTPMPDEATLTAPGGEAEEYWWKDGGKPTGPMAVTTLMDVVQASYYYNDSSEPNLRALDNLQLSQLQGFGIRYNEIGGTYQSTDSLSDFIAAVTTAVAKLPYTVDSVTGVNSADLAMEVQYLLLNPTASYKTAAELRGAGTDYWWQAADPKLEITDKESLLQVAWMAFVEDHPTPEAATALDAIDFELLAKGDHKGGIGLRRTEDGKEFGDTSLSNLKTELERVVKWAKDNQGATYQNLDTAIGSYQLQYLILNSTVGADYKTSEADMATDFDKVYWWKAYDSNPNGPAKEELSVDPADWAEFLEALKGYWNTGRTGKVNAINDLLAAKGDPDYVNKVLMLRMSDSGQGPADAREFNAGDFATLIARNGPVHTALKYSTRGANDFFNAGGTAMNNLPTWEEFQYALLNYDNIDATGDMPDTAGCEAEKTETNYPWMFKGETVVTKEEQSVNSDDWAEFTAALKLYWNTGRTGKVNAINDLLAAKGDPDYVNKVLMLRMSDSGQGPADAREFNAGDFATLIARNGPVHTALKYSTRGANDFFNAGGTAMNNLPTWEEFQYALLNYDNIDATGDMPDTTTCADAKTEANYPWMWKTSGDAPKPKVEQSVNSDDWAEFTAALKLYWNTGRTGKVNAINDLLAAKGDPDYVNNVLMLRMSDSGQGPADAREFNAGDFATLIARNGPVHTALKYSTRGANDFFNAGGTAMNNLPTWEEFQYALLNYDNIDATGDMPDTTTCADAKTEANYPWMWTEEGGSAQTTYTAKPLVESQSTWDALWIAAIEYVANWDTTKMDAIFPRCGIDLINDDFMLRKSLSDSATFASVQEFYKGDNNDFVVDVINLLLATNRAGEFSTQTGVFNKSVPSWEEIQYLIIHFDEIKGNYTLPSKDDIMIEAKIKYTWRYVAS